MERGEKLKLLRSLQVPSVIINSQTVSGWIAKAVLRSIDDHGQTCWASAETIAFETNLTERSVRRSIKALESLGLISVDSRVGRSSLIEIQWHNFTSTPVPKSGVNANSTPVPKSGHPGTKVHPPRYQSPDTPVPKSDEALKKRPLKRERKRDSTKSTSTIVDERLISWIAFWNSLKEKGLVSQGASEVPSEGVQKGWQRVQNSSVLKELLSDRDALEAKIREQPFLKGSWFNLSKLFGGKNTDGEFIVRRILDGGYKSNSKPQAKVITNEERVKAILEKAFSPGINYDENAKLYNPNHGVM